MSQTFRSSYELRVGEDGTLTLPPELRTTLGLQTGDSLTLLQGDGEIWVLPTRLLVPEVARKMEQLMLEKGLTTSDMLIGLDAEGNRLFKEQYGDATAS